MKGLYLICLIFLILLSPFFAEEEKEAVAIITSFSGSVHIERDGEDLPTDAMVQLYSGDKIEIGGDGKLVILYTSGKFRSIGASSSIVIETGRLEVENEEAKDKAIEEKRTEDFKPLFAFKAASERLGGRKGVRAPDTTGIFIFSPGNSVILEDRPQLIWTSVSETKEYSLKIQRMAVAVGTITLSDTAIEYPVDWQSLEHEKSYVMKVEAQKEEKVLASRIVRFKVLSEEKAQIVENEKMAICENSPDEITTHLLLSELYKENRLFGLAIAELDRLIALAPDIPEFHRSLSEVYSDFGLKKMSNRELDKYEELTKGN